MTLCVEFEVPVVRPCVPETPVPPLTPAPTLAPPTVGPEPVPLIPVPPVPTPVEAPAEPADAPPEPPEALPEPPAAWTTPPLIMTAMTAATMLYLTMSNSPARDLYEQTSLAKLAAELYSVTVDGRSGSRSPYQRGRPNLDGSYQNGNIGGAARARLLISHSVVLMLKQAGEYKATASGQPAAANQPTEVHDIAVPSFSLAQAIPMRQTLNP
jgi:hypothetical protein